MVEIIPKEPLKSSKSSNILLYFSLVFLFSSIVSYFILGHFYGKYQKEYYAPLVQNLTEKNKKIYSIKEKLRLDQEKIDDFSFLIAQQLEASKFFTAFEKIVHPQVWFSEFRLGLKEKKVFLSGQAQNFEVLGQQLYVIRNKDWIKDADLEEVSIGKERKINFSLSFILDPMLFNENE